MRDAFITEGIDNQKVLDDARRVSRGDMYSAPEVVQVHWHSARSLCEAKFKHAFYKDGFDQTAEGGGKA